MQPCAGVGGLEGVGPGAQGVVIGGVPHLDDGDVQQQRQILIGRGQVEHHGIVLTLHHTVDVGEAASVVVAVFGGLVGCQHIGNGQGGAVGEPGTGFNIDGIVAVIRGGLIVGAENGHGVVVPVHAEQPLINQGEQHPVCDVVANQGVHGAVGEVGQVQGLKLLVLEGQIFRLLAFHQHFAALGNKIVIPHCGADTAGQGGTQQRRNQQKTDMLFHRDTS